MVRKKLNMKVLDEIIEDTIHRIQESRDQIYDIRNYAEEEYRRIESELKELRSYIMETTQYVEELRKKLSSSKQYLMKISKNHEKYTEKEMKIAYEIADQYRIQLAVVQEREQVLIQKRNGLEIQLKSLHKITEKADHINKNVALAMDVLTENLKNLSTHIGELYETRTLGMKILYAQEEERQRIAREIHDGPAQLMSHMVLKSDLCLKLLTVDTDQCKDELLNLKYMLQKNMGDIRRIIYDLRPMILDDLGLIPALERHIQQVEEVSGFDIYFKKESPTFLLPPALSLTLFRIVQEALNNVVKHAKATQVYIRLGFLKEYIELFIKDDGIGFNVEDKKLREEDAAGFGLYAMKERVHLLQGEFEIRSQIGYGTRYYIRIPLTEEIKGE